MTSRTTGSLITFHDPFDLRARDQKLNSRQIMLWHKVRPTQRKSFKLFNMSPNFGSGDVRLLDVEEVGSCKYDQGLVAD